MIARRFLLLVVVLAVGCTSSHDATSPTSSASLAVHSPSASTATPCAAADLWAAAGPEEGATGHGLLIVAVATRGHSDCVLRGFASVDLVSHDTTGREVARVHATGAPGGFMLNVAPSSDVTLDRDHTAFFGVETTHICQPDATPPTEADELEISINGQAVEPGSPLSVRLSNCGGAGVGAFRSRLADVSNG